MPDTLPASPESIPKKQRQTRTIFSPLGHPAVPSLNLSPGSSHSCGPAGLEPASPCCVLRAGVLLCSATLHTRGTHRAAGRAEAGPFGSPDRTGGHFQARAVSCSHASGHRAGPGGGAGGLGLSAVNRTGRVPAPSPAEDGAWAALSLRDRR